ncbi:hypothetical protein HYFRA_00011255 [Hymenoscyphus fraxineus]|uniref:Uncharacterized protein n=1 Tax=Hymenoscyphus fraxineus TaxID=746836 RepID=A0A9N9KZ74_9HELO|nr:hypothetical protein HYFRA_00011255 [Hymenoscyphus fraxineus]
MHLIRIIPSICLLLSLSFARHIFYPQFLKSLNKRAQIEVDGTPVWGTKPPAPIVADDILRYVNQIAEMSQLIVDHVKEEDAIFLQFFGDVKYYPNVMNIYHRMANIRNPQDQTELRIVVDANLEPGSDSDEESEVSETTAEFMIEDGIANVKAYSAWRASWSFLERPLLTTEHTDVAQLDRMLSSRQAILFHEMLHFVGESSIYGPVVPGEELKPRFDKGSIADVIPFHAASEGRGDVDFLREAMSKPFDERGLEAEVAYGAANCLALPQVRDGPLFAIHNADSYTVFAFAVFMGWNIDQEIVPTHGRLASEYKKAVGGDPLMRTGAPFRGMGWDRDKAFEWWTLLQRRPWPQE